MNVNTKYADVAPPTDERTETMVDGLENMRKTAENDGRSITVFETSTGSEVVNNPTIQWMCKLTLHHNIVKKTIKDALE